MGSWPITTGNQVSELANNPLCWKLAGKGTTAAVYDYACNGGVPLTGQYVTVQNFQNATVCLPITNCILQVWGDLDPASPPLVSHTHTPHRQAKPRALGQVHRTPSSLSGHAASAALIAACHQCYLALPAGLRGANGASNPALGHVFRNTRTPANVPSPVQAAPVWPPCLPYRVITTLLARAPRQV